MIFNGLKKKKDRKALIAYLYYMIRSEFEDPDTQRWIVDKCTPQKEFYDKCIEEHSEETRREKNRKCAKYYRYFMHCVQENHKIVIQKQARYDFTEMWDRKHKKKYME